MISKRFQKSFEMCGGTASDQLTKIAENNQHSMIPLTWYHDDSFPDGVAVVAVFTKPLLIWM